jgi:hypothetical protein
MFMSTERSVWRSTSAAIRPPASGDGDGSQHEERGAQTPRRLNLVVSRFPNSQGPSLRRDPPPPIPHLLSPRNAALTRLLQASGLRNRAAG